MGDSYANYIFLGRECIPKISFFGGFTKFAYACRTGLRKIRLDNLIKRKKNTTVGETETVCEYVG